jgi:hypothetical protein
LKLKESNIWSLSSSCVDALVDLVAGAALPHLGRLVEELPHARKLPGRAKVAVPRSATRGVRDDDYVAVEVGHERRDGAAGVVAAAELNDAALPVAALVEEFVDLVVEVAEAVLAETLVLDLGDLGADLAEDLRAALGGEVGPALSGLARGGRGALAERRRGGRGARAEDAERRRAAVGLCANRARACGQGFRGAWLVSCLRR